MGSTELQQWGRKVHGILPCLLLLLALAVPFCSSQTTTTTPATHGGCVSEEQTTLFGVGGGMMGLGFMIFVVGALCLKGRQEKLKVPFMFVGALIGVVGLGVVIAGAVIDPCSNSTSTSPSASPASSSSSAPSSAPSTSPAPDALFVPTGGAMDLVVAVIVGAIAMLLMFAMFGCLCGKKDDGSTSEIVGVCLPILAAFSSACMYVGAAVAYAMFMEGVEWGLDCEQVPFSVSVGLFFFLMFFAALGLFLMLMAKDDKGKRKTGAILFLTTCIPMFGPLAGTLASCQVLLADLATTNSSSSSNSTNTAQAGDGNGACVLSSALLPRYCAGSNASTDCSQTCQGLPELAASSNYPYFEYYLAAANPSAAGVVACNQIDNFCGTWSDVSNALFENITVAAVEPDMCQYAIPTGIRFYLKYSLQYAGVVSHDATSNHDSALGITAGAPFWIRTLFAWESQGYRVDGYLGQTCSDQFSLRCIGLEDGADVFESIDAFADGVAYTELARNSSGFDLGYNVHLTLQSAQEECASDCECVGIVMASDYGATITLAIIAVLLIIPLFMVLCTVTLIWPIPFCKQCFALVSSTASRREQKAELDGQLEEQVWLTKKDVRKESDKTLKEWVGVDPVAKSFTQAARKTQSKSLDDVANDVAFFLNDEALMANSASTLKKAIGECQGKVQLPLSKDASWAELEANFQRACLYFAARRRRAITALRNKDVARRLVQEFKSLSSSLKNSYDLMLDKKVFHDGFYLHTLKPLCERAAMEAERVLSLGVAEQKKENEAAEKARQATAKGVLKKGAAVWHMGTRATVESFDPRSKSCTVKFQVFDSDANRLVDHTETAQNVVPILPRKYTLRDPDRYRAPHWTQHRNRFLNAPWSKGGARYTRIYADAMQCARFHYPRTMVYVGQFSDMAGIYNEQSNMERLVGYFEDLADLNLQSFSDQFTDPRLKPEQKDLWAKTKRAEDEGTRAHDGVHHLKIAPLKKAWRCAEKAIARTDSNAGVPVYLTDIVRGQVVFRSIYALHAAVEALLNYEHVVVTRVKDRFSKQANGGWADILINFYHEADPNKHCCEVQFVMVQLLLLRGKDLGGHDDFNKFRSSFEVLESTFNMHLLDDTKCSWPCVELARKCGAARSKNRAAAYQKAVKKKASTGGHLASEGGGGGSKVTPVGRIMSVASSKQHARVHNPVHLAPVRPNAPQGMTIVVPKGALAGKSTKNGPVDITVNNQRVSVPGGAREGDVVEVLS